MRGLIEDGKNLGKRLSHRFHQRPTGQCFRHRIQVVDHALRIRRDHGVTDRVQGHLGALFGLEQGFFGGAALYILSIQRHGAAAQHRRLILAFQQQKQHRAQQAA